jgi:hypothetical protein
LLDNCHNCDYCIGCSNLHNKKYHILNQPVSKEEYNETKKHFSSHSFVLAFREQITEYFKNNILKASNIVGSEGCFGDNIINSRHCILSFDMEECSDCKHCMSMIDSQDIYDVSAYGEDSHRMYESVSVGRYSNNILFSSIVGRGENLMYCIDVKRSKHCFGCVNLEEKEYCILNKQYTKEEYESLVPKIIKKMKADGERGEFFSYSLSPFGYNETLAQEGYSLKKSEALES